MIHLDLFSGIGGFAYAAKIVWGEEYNNILFCDNNKFCQAVIRKNFGKDSVIYDDVRDVANTKQQPFEEEINERGINFKEGDKIWEIGGTSVRKCDLLTGGFPCQPFSQAGKRKGTNDNRYLWPEMLRVIQEFKPTWVVAENVRGLLTIEQGMVFEQVCLDLERENYSVQAFVIPAVAVNAPHRRDRVWFVAHRNDTRSRTPRSGVDRNGSSENERREKQSLNGVSGQVTANTGCEHGTGTEKSGELTPEIQHKEDAIMSERPVSDVGNAIRQGLQGRNEFRQSSGERFDGTTSWQQNWLEVATELCRVDDGLSEGLDFSGYTKAGHRVERLKALGNAIVPQVAIEIFKAIREIDNAKI